MAKSTYLSTHLNEDQTSFFRLLEENEVLYFSLEDVHQRLGTHISGLNEVVENLYRKGLLVRVEKGVYTRPMFLDVQVLGSFISQGGILSYWSALHQHNLTIRFPNTVFFKTSVRKRDTDLFGTKVKFITVHPRKMIGIKYEGYGDKQYPLSDIESTILDCYDQPRYGGDLPDLINAFYQAEMNPEKLIGYAEAYDNISVTRRLGFLAEFFQKTALDSFVYYAKTKVRDKYSLFEAGGAQTGKFNPHWKLRMNLTEEAILDMVHNPY